MPEQENENRTHAQVTCSHCGGNFRHEAWCSTARTVVNYAWKIIVDPTKMTREDALVLHRLGVCWAEEQTSDTPLLGS